MKMLSIRELREVIGSIDEIVNKSGGVVITRHGKPLARILPYTNYDARHKARKKFRESLPRMKVSSSVLVREDRDRMP